MDFHISKGNAAPIHGMKYHRSGCTASTHSWYFDVGEKKPSRPDRSVLLRTH